MSTTFLAIFAIILCVLFRLLNVNAVAHCPKIFCLDEKFNLCISKICPELKEIYIPTRLWGFSGHVQTILQSIVGRVKCPWPLGERVYISLSDGSTLTYDLYQPLTSVRHDEDITVAVCPGVGNSSESVYIRTFVHYAQCHGYRIAVLNHIGVIDTIQVTSPRIFTYGHTDDFTSMVNSLVKKNPNAHIIAVGFSLGGNLITKYLGETAVTKPKNVIGGISICQGYDANVATNSLMTWQNFQRFYLYVLTENVKSIIMKHRHVLLSDEVKRRFGLVESDIAKAATLPELDDAYTRKVHNFASTTELYKWSSSINYMKNIDKPVVFINALDDPLVPELLLDPIRNFSQTHKQALYIECAHGGHLGFYEGGLLNPDPLTWLDRILVSLLGGIAFAHADMNMKKSTMAM